MRHEFIQTLGFSRDAARLRLSLDDIRAIENAIGESPLRWPLIPGAAGLRKMRHAPEASAGGKSGGVRVCYFLVDRAHHVYLVTIFAKNQKATLSAADLSAIRALVSRIKKAYE